MNLSFLIFCGIVAAVCAECEHPKGMGLLPFLLKCVNKVYYAQHYLGPAILTPTCWRAQFFLKYFHMSDLGFHLPIPYVDEHNVKQNTTLNFKVADLNGNFHLRSNNTDYRLTVLFATPTYAVEYYCSDKNEPSVYIFTTEKEHNQELIDEIIERTSKIVKLPKGSVKSNCQDTDL